MDGVPTSDAELRSFALLNLIAPIDRKDWVRKRLCPRLLKAGLFFRAFKTTLGDAIIVEVYAPMGRLEREAQRVALNLELDRDTLRVADIETNEALQEAGLGFKPPEKPGEKPQKITNKKQLAIPPMKLLPWEVPMDPYQHVFAPYIDFPLGNNKRDLYYLNPRSHHAIGDRHAVVLLQSILEAPRLEGGVGLDLDSQVARGNLERYFPSLGAEQRKSLWENWVIWCGLPWRQPLSHIREVFGERIAFYFAFLGQMTWLLVFPAAVGLALFVNQLVDGTPSVAWLPVFGILVALWTTVFLELWKRKESRLAAKWGTVGVEEKQRPRPEYLRSTEVRYRRSPVTGKPEYYRNPVIGSLKVTLSSLIISIIVGLVVVLVLTVFFIRVLLHRAEQRGEVPAPWGGYLASIIQAVIIMVMDKMYGAFATFLTDFENQPTDVAYNASRNIKAWCFQFINSYYALFWIITAKQANVTIFGEVQQCQPDCLSELQNSLGSIFLTRVLVNNFMEVGLPIVMGWIGNWRQSCCGCCCKRTEEEERLASTPASKISNAERERKMGVFDVEDEYLEQLILFGYASMFVTAFPIAPFIMLLNNYVEIRIDGVKILQQSVRPMPNPAAGIGVWYGFFESISYISVVTNLIVITFTNPDGFFGYTSTSSRLIIFIILEHIFLLAKYVLARLIPDQDHETAATIARNNYLVNKLLHDVPDPIEQDEFGDEDEDGEGDMEAASADVRIEVYKDYGEANSKPNPLVQSYIDSTSGAGEEKAMG